MLYDLAQRHLFASNTCTVQFYNIIMRKVFCESLFSCLYRFISDPLKKFLKLFFLHNSSYFRAGAVGDVGFLFAKEFMRATARNLATVVAVASPGTAVDDLKISCS